MRGPQDFDKLTPEDLEQVEDLQKQAEEWFGKGNRSYDLYTQDDELRGVPTRVWEELVRRANVAKWNASLNGFHLKISR